MYHCYLSFLNIIHKLKKAVSWLLRFKDKLLGKPIVKNVTVGDMKRAEFEIIKTVQSNVFGGEIKNLKNNKVVKKNSSIYNFKSFLCTGIIRVGGRLNAAELTFE